MKKLLLTFIAALVCMISVATAQTRLEWKNHGIEFTLAKDLVVQTNTSENFVAVSKSKDFAVSMGPLDRTGLTEQQLGEIIGEKALDDLGIDPESAEIETFECTGGHGAFIMGVDQDGQLCMMAAAVSSYGKKALIVVEYFSEARAREAGELLGSIKFNR